MAMTPPIMPEGQAVWNSAPINATKAMYTATTPPPARAGVMGETAGEIDIHIHQPVPDDGVSETKRYQHQGYSREIHPGARHNAQRVGHDVQKKERKNAGGCPSSDPFELLTEDSRSCVAVTVHEGPRGKHEVNAQTSKVQPVE